MAPALSCFQFDVRVLEKRMADVLKHMPKKVVADTSTMVIAPMPGMVKSIAVKVGDQVSWKATNTNYNNYNYND